MFPCHVCCILFDKIRLHGKMYCKIVRKHRFSKECSIENTVQMTACVIGPLRKGQNQFMLKCLILEDGTDKLF